jgi:DNA-nicking Smr family endonuclease
VSDEPEDDENLFDLAMRGVRPMKRDPRGRVRTARPVEFEAPPAPMRQDEPEPEGEYVAKGIDRRELRRLKRREYGVEARTDLHGMTVADAVETTRRFIDNSRHRRLRCVAIVHGRGLHSEDETSVVKARVRLHLRANPLVLAYADAPPDDGGPGAVYVLLKR